MVANSRTSVRSPMTTRVGSPWYFTSCGAAPMITWEPMRHSAPISVRPSRMVWLPMLVPAPTRTSGPTIA
jgi:hypothetical protein